MTGTIRQFDPSVIQSEAGIVLRSDIADQVAERVEDGDGVVFVADYIILANVDHG